MDHSAPPTDPSTALVCVAPPITCLLLYSRPVTHDGKEERLPTLQRIKCASRTEIAKAVYLTLRRNCVTENWHCQPLRRLVGVYNVSEYQDHEHNGHITPEPFKEFDLPAIGDEDKDHMELIFWIEKHLPTSVGLENGRGICLVLEHLFHPSTMTTSVQVFLE